MRIKAGWTFEIEHASLLCRSPFRGVAFKIELADSSAATSFLNDLTNGEDGTAGEVFEVLRSIGAVETGAETPTSGAFSRQVEFLDMMAPVGLTGAHLDNSIADARVA